MERSEVAKYISKFSLELKNFLILLDELMPTETVQNILKKYDNLDPLKLMYRYRKSILKHKTQSVAIDESIFKSPLYIIPEVDISFYWNNLQPNHRCAITERLTRLIICSNVIVEKMKPRKCESECPKKKTINVSQNVSAKQNLFDGVGDENENISVETFTQESENARLDCNPMLNKLREHLNVDKLSEQLNNIDEKSMDKMADGIGQFIDPTDKNPEVKTFFKGAMCNIVDKLKTHDFKNEGLFDVVKQVSSEIADNLISDTQNNKCNPEQLLESAQSILKGLGIGDNITPENLNPASLMNVASQLINSINQNETQSQQNTNTQSSTVSMMDLAGKFLGL